VEAPRTPGGAGPAKNAVTFPPLCSLGSRSSPPENAGRKCRDEKESEEAGLKPQLECGESNAQRRLLPRLQSSSAVARQLPRRDRSMSLLRGEIRGGGSTGHSRHGHRHVPKPTRVPAVRWPRSERPTASRSAGLFPKKA